MQQVMKRGRGCGGVWRAEWRGACLSHSFAGGATRNLGPLKPSFSLAAVQRLPRHNEISRPILRTQPWRPPFGMLVLLPPQRHRRPSSTSCAATTLKTKVRWYCVSVPPRVALSPSSCLIHARLMLSEPISHATHHRNGTRTVLGLQRLAIPTLLHHIIRSKTIQKPEIPPPRRCDSRSMCSQTSHS